MFTLVAQGPQVYKVVRYNAFRYLDSKEGSDGAHLIASVKPFQTLVDPNVTKLGKFDNKNLTP